MSRRRFLLVYFCVAAVISGVSCFAEQEAVCHGRSVRQWLDIYGEYNSRTRDEAAEALLEMGTAAVPHVIEALHDEKVQVRKGAARILRKFGPMASDAVPALIEATQDGDHWVRVFAIEAIGSIGPSAEAAKPALIRLLKDRDSEVRVESACALAKVEPGNEEAISGLFEAFKKVSGRSNRAEWAFVRMGPIAIPILVAALEHENPAIRECVSSALSKMGEAALPALSTAMDDSHDKVRAQAVYTIGRMRRSVSMPEDVVQHVVGRLDDSSAHVRSKAARALGNIWAHTEAGETGKAAIAPLVKLLEDKNADVRSNATYALWRVGPEARVAIPALRKAQEDSNEQVREGATDALYRLGGAEAGATVAKLIDILTHGEAAESAKRTLRGRHHPIMRFEAAMYLGRRSRDEAKRAIPVLKRLLNDTDPAVRFNAAVALWKLQPGSPSPVPVLESALVSVDPEVRIWAAHALVQVIGADAHKAIPTLVSWLMRPRIGAPRAATQEKSEAVRRRALSTLIHKYDDAFIWQIR